MSGKGRRPLKTNRNASYEEVVHKCVGLAKALAKEAAVSHFAYAKLD